MAGSATWWLGLGLLAGVALGCPQDVTPLPGPDAGLKVDAGAPDAGPVARCGDGRAEPAEACDGEDLKGTTCDDLGLGEGALACAADCARFDLSGCQACVPQCGARTCGLEPVCNSSCGTCGVDEGCTTAGQCLPTCPPGSFTCTADGQGYQACGPNDALGIPDLGPRVGCAPGSECEAGNQPCKRGPCVGGDLMVVVDRSAASSSGGTWSWMREALVSGLGRRDHAVRLGLRQFPDAACQAGAAGALTRDAADALGQAMVAPGPEASSPLYRALEGLQASFTPGVDGQAVLLIATGDETCDPPDAAVEEAGRLFRLGVRVYVVALTSRAHRAYLDRVAQAGGTGAALGADDPASFAQALEDVFADLGTCEDPTPVVAAGYYHACRLLSGRVQCWGRPDDARLVPPPGPHRHLAAGTDNACAVGEDGVVRCWGRDHRGQSSPPAGAFQQVSGGDSHFCGLKLDGTAVCWGFNDVGQATAPAGVFKQVTTAGFFSCGLRGDDTVTCWGGGAALQGTFRQIDGGSFSLCGVATDGSLACNGFPEAPPAGRFVAVSAGADHACAIREDRELLCWGLNHVGQCDAPAGPFVAVDVNNAYTCATRPDGAVLCFGEGSNGQTAGP
jgi:hypothetical protein